MRNRNQLPQPTRCNVATLLIIGFIVSFGKAGW